MKKLHSWIIKSTNKQWPNLFSKEQTESLLEKSIPRLETLELMSSDEIKLFLGKWQINTASKYSKPIMNDWAASALNRQDKEIS